MRRWSLAPEAVAAGRDITGTVHTGPMYVQVLAGRFDRLHDAIFDPAPLEEQLDLARQSQDGRFCTGRSQIRACSIS
ncbi:hypothetical protein [Virgisporangium aurantiacum]|nr:hypothetical protein [Virgisporangium aurantiacum]